MEEMIGILREGAIKLGIELPLGVQDKIIRYIKLLSKWNGAYNLTAIRDEKEIIISHILDSLSIFSHIKGNWILDVGTGAGFPGIPLALLFPDKNFVLLDSNNKKTRFLTYVKTILEIDNIEVVTKRVEHFKPIRKFDCIVSRAFGSVVDIVNKVHSLLNKHGCLLLMKGVVPEEEIGKISMKVEVCPLIVPFLNANRCLLTLYFT